MKRIVLSQSTNFRNQNVNTGNIFPSSKTNEVEWSFKVLRQ